ISGEPGRSGFTFAFQWIFAILEPSGKGLPLPGMPDLKALMITGFPTITAIVPARWLAAITSQFSYPRKSENARPPGTRRVYLSWLAAEIATPKTMAITITMPVLISLPLLFISAAPCLRVKTDGFWTVQVARHPHTRTDDYEVQF